MIRRNKHELLISRSIVIFPRMLLFINSNDWLKTAIIRSNELVQILGMTILIAPPS